VAVPSDTTIKKLFALSSNRCAFPGCPNHLIDPSGALLGRVCHIRADSPGGKRYDPNQTEAERQGFTNLIVLCANHHIVIDDDDITYTVAVLEDMKQRHEQMVTKPFVISDDTARRILELMAAGAIGAAISDVMREVTDFARSMANALSSRGQKEAPADDPGERLLKDIQEILRYGPKGRFTFCSKDDAHKQVGAFFAEIFKSAGWRVVSPGRDQIPRSFAKEVGPALLLLFLVKEEHQMSNAWQTVSQILSRCGFEPIDRTDGAKYRSGDGRLRILPAVGIFR
jgi:hypothetical protein